MVGRYDAMLEMAIPTLLVWITPLTGAGVTTGGGEGVSQNIPGRN